MLFLTSIPTTILALWASLGTSDPAVLPSFNGYSHSGNGCPQSSVVDKTGGFSDLALTFGSFATESSTTANCAVHLHAAGASPGWQLGLKRVHVTGHEVLTPGASIQGIVQAFWTQDPAYTRTANVHSTNAGGGTTRKTTTLTVDYGDDLLWSPCTGASGDMGIFNPNFRAVSSVGAYFGNGAGVRTTETFEWVWRRC